MPLMPHPGHKLQKPSKESGIFQSRFFFFGTISFVFFSLKGKVKRRGHGTMPSKYASGYTGI